MQVPFVKFSGAGNDMILVDHRDDALRGREEQFARGACDRRFGIGADGVILLENDDAPDSDFFIRFFNPDGGEYALCGNGARCVLRFAAEIGMPGPDYRFRSDSGHHRGRMLDDSEGRIELAAVREIRLDVPARRPGTDVTLDWGDIGVPHAALWVDDVDEVPVEEWGRALRDSAAFSDGTNISFVQVVAPGHLRMRTFERGVEAETWACGSGACVVATLARERGHVTDRAEIEVRGGRLTVELPESAGKPLILAGPVHRCCHGTFELD